MIDKVKVGLVYVGPIGDHGSTYHHDLGCLAIEAALDDKAETTYAARFYEGRTVLGKIAGRMTKSKAVGYIDSFPVPEMVRGVFAFGQASDMRKFAPKAQLTAIIDNWDQYYVARANAVLDGSWKSEDTWGGLDTGMVEMAPYGDAVPAEVRKLADETIAAIKAGTLHPFTGPIKDQAGKERIAAGAVADDGMLLGMDWYVPGLDGVGK